MYRDIDSMYKPVKVVVAAVAAMLLVAACDSGAPDADDEAAIANAVSAEGQSLSMRASMDSLEFDVGDRTYTAKNNCLNSQWGGDKASWAGCYFLGDDGNRDPYFSSSNNEWFFPTEVYWLPNPDGSASTVIGIAGRDAASGQEYVEIPPIVLPNGECIWTPLASGEEVLTCTGGVLPSGDYWGPVSPMTWSAGSDSWQDVPLGQEATHEVVSSCEDSRGCTDGRIRWSADGIRILKAEPSGEGTTCSVEEDGTASCEVGGFRPGYTSKVTLTYEKASTASQEVTVAADCVGASGSACESSTVNAPGLSVTTSGPQKVSMGADVNYAVFVANDTSEPVPGVVVAMTSNDGMVEVVNASGGDGWACDAGTMECTSESLAPGAASAVGFIVNVSKDWCIKQGTIQAIASVTVKGAEPVTSSVDLNPGPCPGDVVVEPGSTSAEIAVGGVMTFEVEGRKLNWSISSSDPGVMEVFGGAMEFPMGNALTAGNTEVVLTNSFTGETWTIQVTVTP